MFRYLHLDVFTDRRFEGNQLAVFPEPRGLTTDQMQRIAKEMAFSESTFIFPPERGGDVRMRIFTPGEELPMAGHPTIGSTFALAIEGTIRPWPGAVRLRAGRGPDTGIARVERGRAVVCVDDTAIADIRCRHH